MVAHLLIASAFVALLYLAACFSALESALFLLREKQSAMVRGVTEGERSKLKEIARNPMAVLPDVLLLGGLSNLILAALGVYLVLYPLRHMGCHPGWGALAVFGVGLFVVEIVPKSFAQKFPEGSLRMALPVLLSLRGFFAPLANALQRASDRLMDAIPSRLRPRQGLNLEEVVTLIEMREEQGSISGDEASVLQQILSLCSLTVKDCMTPRVDLPLMPHDASDEEARRMIESSRFRLVPVFDERADTITGLIDAEAWRLAQRPPWRTLVQPPVYVHETMKLLECMQRHVHRAGAAVVILDEYGSVEGLLSGTNISERLLYKAAPAQSAERAIQPLGAGRYLVSGLARIDDVNRELEVDLNAPAGMDTIGGLVFNRLGYLPRPGEQVQIGEVVMKVKRTTRNRIQQLEVQVDENHKGAR